MRMVVDDSVYDAPAAQAECGRSVPQLLGWVLLCPIVTFLPDVNSSLAVRHIRHRRSRFYDPRPRTLHSAVDQPRRAPR